MRSKRTGGGGAEFCFKRGGGGSWNPKVQKFVYQKQPKSVFPLKKFHLFPRAGPRGGGGGAPAGDAELLSKTPGRGGGVTISPGTTLANPKADMASCTPKPPDFVRGKFRPLL